MNFTQGKIRLYLAAFAACAMLLLASGRAFAQVVEAYVDVSGNKELTDEKVRGIIEEDVKKFVESGFKPSFLDDGIYKLERHYKEKGYYFAKASLSVSDNAEKTKKIVKVEIVEGPVVKLKAIKARGNEEFTRDELKEIFGRSILEYFSGEKLFLDSDVESAKSQLEDFYKKRGFAKVRTTTELKFNDDRTEVTVYLNLFEGKKYYIKVVNIVGLPEDSYQEMIGQLRKYEGDPYTSTLEEGLATLMKTLLSDKGHPFAVVNYYSYMDNENGEVVTMLDVKMGPVATIKDIKLQGNEKTKDWVIKKHMLFVRGDRFTKWRVADAQKKLLNSGFFKSAEVSFEKANEDGSEVDIFVNVAEQDKGQLKARAGYGYYEGAHIGLDFIYDNIDGRGKKVKASGKISERGFKYDGQFYIPWIGRSDFNLNGLPSYERREETSYSFLKTAMEGSISRTMRDGKTTGALGVKVESVNLYDIEASLPTEEDEYQSRSMFITVTRDTRDDLFNPKDGSLWTGGVEYGGGPLRGTIDFWKASFRTSRYWTFLDNAVIGAASLSSGVIEPLGETEEVPISKRFFLGGENTLRGFEENMIGPKTASGAPYGGRAFLNFNVELRPEIWNGLYGAIFFDMGNVWGDSSDYFSGRMRTGAGVGLRFVTPVGPFRLDFGKNLDRMRGEDLYEAYLSVGYPF